MIHKIILVLYSILSSRFFVELPTHPRRSHRFSQTSNGIGVLAQADIHEELGSRPGGEFPTEKADMPLRRGEKVPKM
jgi:hypothetical protein